MTEFSVLLDERIPSLDHGLQLVLKRDWSHMPAKSTQNLLFHVQDLPGIAVVGRRGCENVDSMSKDFFHQIVPAFLATTNI